MSDVKAGILATQKKGRVNSPSIILTINIKQKLTSIGKDVEELESCVILVGV
jgi:hypothetical protein